MWKICKRRYSSVIQLHTEVPGLITSERRPTMINKGDQQLGWCDGAIPFIDLILNQLTNLKR